MDTNVRIKLKPISDSRAPKCNITVGYVTKMRELDKEQWVEFLIYPDKGSNIDLIIEHHGKTDAEFKSGKELAILIEEIEINGVSDSKFLWQGKFYPNYPSWEKDQGPLDTHYLGFNGSWKLNITIPAYTWIHKTLDLGWIYD